MNWRGWDIASGDHRLVSMDGSYHMEQEYTCIWFSGGDLNDFRDIRSLLSEAVEHDSATLPQFPLPPPSTTHTRPVANLDLRDMIDRIYVGDH